MVELHIEVAKVAEVADMFRALYNSLSFHL